MIDDLIDFMKEFLLPVLIIGVVLITLVGVPIVGVAYLLERTSCYQRAEVHELEVVFRFPAGCIIKTSDPDHKVRILSK